jgi:hypothetical protein
MTRFDLIMRAVRAVAVECFPAETRPAAAHILDVYTDHATRLPGFMHARICTEFQKIAGTA